MPNEEQNDGVIFIPPPEEAEWVKRHRDNITKMKEFMNHNHKRFDGLTLLQTYYANEDAAVSYLRPKRNDDEVRIVSGSTEKRLESIYNELLSMNTGHELHAFDKQDREIKELGEAMDDVITRTNELEMEEDIRAEALSEFITQPAVFLEETWEDKHSSGFNIGMPRKRLKTALEVLLGDVTIPLFRLYDQPCIVTYERMSHQALSRYFGKDERWDFVKPGMNLDNDIYGIDLTFRVGMLAEHECEIVKYYSVPDDEFTTYINGVPMKLSMGKMPTRTYGKPYYPISAGGAKRMSARFSYCRPPVMTLKFIQALTDETIRNIIRKFRQAIEPPRAVQNSSRIYSRDIFEAGKVTYGVDADAFKKLVDHDGVTQGEMNVLQMVKEMQDEIASRSATQLGIQQGERRTATEIVQMQKEAIQMLGTLVINWNRFLRDANYNRIYNIEQNMMKPSGMIYDSISGGLRATYRSLTLKGKTLKGGKSGNSTVQFSDRDLTEAELLGLEKYEDKNSKRGQKINISNINVKAYKEAGVKWFVIMTSKPKQTDDLHQLMFQDKLNQAAGLSKVTMRQLNADRIIDEFEETWRVENWFAQTPQNQPSIQGQGVGGELVGQGMNPRQPLQTEKQSVQPALANIL